ncbi:MAG: hypothetical protein ACLQJR_10645 [Stellaceae bacterium]
MDHVQYLRGRAAEFANLAVTTSDPVAARNLHELAILCQESAERLERRAEAREPASSAAR